MTGQKCIITGLPAGHPDACQDCDPCTWPGCWTDETIAQREADQELRRRWGQERAAEAPCPYCYGDGVERVVGYDNDVIEQPCPRGCPTPFQRQTANAKGTDDEA